MASENVTSALRSFGKDTLLYVPYRLFPVLFGFAGLWIYTRVFSPSEYGIYSLLMVTIGLLGILAYGWIDDANLRFYARYKHDGRLSTYFTTSITLQALALVVIGGLLIAMGYLSLLPGELVSYLLLLVGAMVVLSFFESVMTFLQPERKATEGSIYRFLSAFLLLAIALVFIFVFRWGLASILLSYIITSLALAIVVTLRNHYLSYLDPRSFSLATAMEFIGYGLPLMGQQLFFWVLVLSDRYVIEYFRGSQEVGIYSAAYQLADYPISMFTSMMLIAAFPIIVDVWEKKGEAPTRKLITGLMRYYLLFVIPAIMGLTLLSQNIMAILTDAYASGFIIVPFVCLSHALYGVVWYQNVGMKLKKKTFVQAVLIIIAGLIDIGLNILLVPWLGFAGAGVSLVVSYVVYMLLTSVVSRRYFTWPMPWSSIKNILVATAVMGIAVAFARQFTDLSLVSLVLLIAIGALVYLPVVWLTGEIREEAGYVTGLTSAAGRKTLRLVRKTLPSLLTAWDR